MNFSQELVQRLATAENVAVLTGAGISAESGIPTFRGKDGLWKNLKPEELASEEAFQRHPEHVWEWYSYRRDIIRKVQPNPAHLTLAEMENHFTDFSICTQNVDGLHSRAGSKNVREIHGNILRNRCNSCKSTNTIKEFDQSVPLCNCGGMLRPDVVWFGETIPNDVLLQSTNDAEMADIYFTLGTSALVYPAAGLPLVAKNHGAFVVEINLEPTQLSRLVDESIIGTCGSVLPALWQIIVNLKKLHS